MKKKTVKKTKGKKKSAVKKKTTQHSPKKKTKAKKSVKKTAKKGKRPVAKTTAPKIEGTFIGRVTHYFPHVNAAVVKIEKSSLKLGDKILVKGHTTNFKQPINSLQIDRSPIEEAKPGDEIGLEVKSRVREHDAVYKIK